MKYTGYIRFNASYFFIFILLLCILSCSDSKQEFSGKENTVSGFGLKGNVRSASVTDFRTKGDPGETQRGDILSKSIYLFDQAGRLTEDQQYNSNGRLSWRSELKYDNEGDLMEKTTYFDSLELGNKIIYKYGDKHNIIEETSTNSKGEIEYRIDYKYNRKGNLAEKQIFRPAEKFWNISLYYDENNNIKKRSSYSVTEAQVTKFLYIYDKKNNCIEEVYLRPDGSRGSKYIDKFDIAGNKIAAIVYGADDSIIYKSVYKYDETGNLVERLGGIKDNEQKTEQRFKYDSSGNIIEEINYNGWMDSKTTYEYLNFDHEGNWLVRKILVSLLSTEKKYSYVEREREISYY